MARKYQGFNLKTPIHFCIFVQDNQEQALEELNNIHNKTEKKENDLRKLINIFVRDNKKNKHITNLPYIDNLLASLNQIEYSFSEFKEVEKQFNSNINIADNKRYYFLEKKTASILVFFFNAFSFIKIVEKNTSIHKNIVFNKLLTSITTIRHHFAHSYEKDIYIGTESKAFVNIQIQSGLDLDSLVLTDISTGNKIGRLWFSVPIFYFSLRDIFKELKDNPKLFIKT